MTNSIREVARLAGVSVATVSNVLNRPELVAASTRQRVESAIDELRFVRNESARTLRVGRSRTVGLVVLDIANPFFTDIARGVESFADEHDLLVTLCNSGEDVERERSHLNHLQQQRARGVLITPVEDGGDPLRQLVASGTPVVLVDRTGGADTCSVAVDDVHGGRLAGEHLLLEGHRRLAFIGGPLTLAQVRDRREGIEAAVALTDNASLLVVETSALTVAGGRSAAGALLKTPRASRVTAVFCANDLLALGVLQECTRNGVRVPEDLAVVGYDDIDFAAAAAVPLSSIAQPREELGRTAAEMLFDEVEHAERHQHRQIVFQPTLVVRESSRPPALGEQAAAAGAETA